MIADFLRQTAQLLERLDQAAIARARNLLIDAYRRGGRVITAGNGGSASTAKHFACDLAKYVIPPGARPFDVRCLTDNVSLYTAWANDAARDDVFANLMRGLLKPEDVLILISVHGGTGFSGDLVHALRYASEIGARTISLVGFDGGILHRESTCSILVPIDSTPQTEAIHLVIEHLLMHVLKDALRGEKADNGRSLRGTRRLGHQPLFGRLSARKQQVRNTRHAGMRRGAGRQCGLPALPLERLLRHRRGHRRRCLWPAHHRRVSRRGRRRQPAGTEPRSSYAGLGRLTRMTETGVG